MERTKLRLGLKVGIFYFQYTLLRQVLNEMDGELLNAPRKRYPDPIELDEGAADQNESELLAKPSKGDIKDLDKKFQLLQRHKQPENALGLDIKEDSNEQAQRDLKTPVLRKSQKGRIIKLRKEREIPSFIYTSAHVRDLAQIKAMAAELV